MVDVVLPGTLPLPCYKLLCNSVRVKVVMLQGYDMTLIFMTVMKMIMIAGKCKEHRKHYHSIKPCALPTLSNF